MPLSSNNSTLYFRGLYVPNMFYTHFLERIMSSAANYKDTLFN